MVISTIKTDWVYLQFMSTCTVASSGCVLLLLAAWHFNWECRSWRPRFLTVISLRTRWPPTLVWRTVETSLTTCSFRYHVTTGRGLPMTQETKRFMQFLRFSQRCCWGFRPSWMWRCVAAWGRHLTHWHNATSQKPECDYRIVCRLLRANFWCLLRYGSLTCRKCHYGSFVLW